MSIRNTYIPGDVSAGGHMAMGGNATVRGSVKVDHNLRVEGWLDAPNIKGVLKGVFTDTDKLQETYPCPQDGWLAAVGTSSPFDAYTGEDGCWVATGGTVTLNFDDSRMTAIEDEMGDVRSSISGLADVISIMDMADIDLTSGFDKATFLTRGYGASLYKVTRGTRVIGTLLIFACNDSRVITEVFTTNEQLSGGTFNGGHTHADVHTYIRFLGNNTTVATSSSATWTAWKEQVANALGDDEHVAISQAAVSGAVNSLNTGLAEETTARTEADTAMQDSITELEKSVWPLSVELSLSASLLEYTGSAQNVTVTRTVKRKGGNVASSSISSATVLLNNSSGTSSVDTSTDNPKSVTKAISNYGDNTFQCSVTALGMAASASRTVRMELPMYFGFSSATSVSSLSITSLGKQSVRTSPAGTYSLANSVAGNHLWLCVPSVMTISKVTSGGFDVPMLAVASGSTSLGSYKCYRSASESGINAGTITIVIS